MFLLAESPRWQLKREQSKEQRAAVKQRLIGILESLGLDADTAAKVYSAHARDALDKFTSKLRKQMNSVLAALKADVASESKDSVAAAVVAANVARAERNGQNRPYNDAARQAWLRSIEIRFVERLVNACAVAGAGRASDAALVSLWSWALEQATDDVTSKWHVLGALYPPRPNQRR